MAILQLRAMRGWNKAETGRHFFVSDDTIRTWVRRANDDSLVQIQPPVNRFPDFVRYAVQQIKLFCPTLGKVKIADMLARAGVHIGKTTVGRILKEKPVESPEPTTDDTGKLCRIVSKYPSHTWHADLTAVPSERGFRVHWLLFVLPVSGRDFLAPRHATATICSLLLGQSHRRPLPARHGTWRCCEAN